MGRVFFLQIGLFQLLALSWLILTADAREAHDRPSVDRMIGHIHQSLSQKGTLQCETLPHQESACRLLFQPTGSRKRYTLVGQQESLMRLYLDGKRDVSIQGSTRGQYLRVEKVRAL